MASPVSPLPHLALVVWFFFSLEISVLPQFGAWRVYVGVGGVSVSVCAHACACPLCVCVHVATLDRKSVV